MEKESFFALFGRRSPSVVHFYELMAREPLETRIEYYRYAFFMFVNCFFDVSQRQQDFLINLVNRNLQHFHTYKMKHSGFYTLRCKVANPQSIIRVSHKSVTSSILANLQLIIAILLTMSGIALLFTSFFIDPQGEIDSSVLVAFGEVSTFAGTLFGVDYKYKLKIKN